MPLSGEKYVAPIWQNGGPPALDADELNAISQSIVRNQGGIDDLNALAQQLSAAVGGAARVEVGSYVGTGTYGSDSPNSLSFENNIQIILLFTRTSVKPSYGSQGYAYPLSDIFIYPVEYGGKGDVSTAFKGYCLPLSWEADKVSWYAKDLGSDSYADAGKQYNSTGAVYYYIAIAKELPQT